MVSTWLPLYKSEPMWSKASSMLLTHDLPVQKPCCLGEITWYRWSMMLFNTQRSKTLDTIGNREMGRWFSTWSFAPFLWTGTTLASFQSLGRDPSCSDLLKILHKKGAITEAVSLSNLAGISSSLVAFLTSSALSAATTVHSLRVWSDITVSERMHAASPLRCR